MNDATGLELSAARFKYEGSTEVPILRSAALAQIHVPYDNGTHENWDLPGFGRLTAAMRPADCARGQRLPAGDPNPPLCVVTTTDDFRFAWDDYDFGTGNHTGAGACLVLYTLTPADWYSYISMWQFCDDASIKVSIGAGGTLAPEIFGDREVGGPIGPGATRFATAHYHNYFWRIEFALGDPGQTQVLQTDIATSGRRRPQTVTPLTAESAAQDVSGRLWTVQSTALLNADHRPIAYDISAHNPDPYRNAPGRPYTDQDMYITEYNNCELLAARNNSPGCGPSVDTYVNGQSLHRPVFWVQESFHHIPRDEDEPIMNEHWSGFELSPRGLSATNPLPPK
jgi:primary-amine oxidase